MNHGKLLDSDLERLPKQERALRLRSRGHTYAMIGQLMGTSRAAAHKLVMEALEERRSEVTELAEDVRQQELEHLDEIKRSALKILDRQHLLTSGIDVVTYQGQPLFEDKTALYAIDRLIKVSEQRAKLLGLNAPVQLDGSALKVEIVGVDTDALR